MLAGRILSVKTSLKNENIVYSKDIYPCLKKHTYKGFWNVVLFVSPGTGILVDTNRQLANQEKKFLFSDDWDEPTFELLDTTECVVLRNV